MLKPFSPKGLHTLTLTVTDVDGAQNSTSVFFNIIRGIILAPDVVTLDVAGEPLQLVVKDRLGNTLPSSKFAWSVVDNNTPACAVVGTDPIVEVTNGPGTPAGFVKPLSIGSATVTATHISGLFATATIDVVGSCPDINVKEGINTIVHSQNIIQADFGNIAVGNSSPPVIFMIENLGISNLEISSITSNNAEFTVSGLANPSIPPGGSATFTVTFSSTAIEGIQASITILSNDTDESPFFFLIKGTGGAPEIVVGGVPDSSPAFIRHHFGTVSVGSSSPPVTISIHNLGNANLEIASIHSNNPEFSVSLPSLTSIPVGGISNFTIVFTPQGVRPKEASIAISSNDTDMKIPFSFCLKELPG